MTDSEWHGRFAAPAGTVYEVEPLEDLSTCPWCNRLLLPGEYVWITSGYGRWHYDCPDIEQEIR